MPPIMKVNKLDEAGYEAALKGLSLNKKKDPELMKNVALRLAPCDGGHNKFLESIYVWLEVTGPRYFWSEADTYRLSTKQSQSTMHTLKQDIINTTDENLKELFEITPSQEIIDELRKCAKGERDFLTMKAILPEGFIQKRVWVMSYKTLRNIIEQRKFHRLPHWRMFIEQVLEQICHPELLPSPYPTEDK